MRFRACICSLSISNRKGSRLTHSTSHNGCPILYSTWRTHDSMYGATMCSFEFCKSQKRNGQALPVGCIYLWELNLECIFVFDQSCGRSDCVFWPTICSMYLVLWRYTWKKLGQTMKVNYIFSLSFVFCFFPPFFIIWIMWMSKFKLKIQVLLIYLTLLF